MAKRNKKLDYERRIKEGRGTGTFEDYKPWITVQDFPSLGRISRIKGLKTKRQHEFLSTLEKKYFYLLDFSTKVVDIREQYPLLPIEETILIAKELGLEHPKNPNTKEFEAMTTDFLITLVDNNGEIVEIARTLKYKKDLLEKRVLEKFEIERQYFKKLGIDWGIVTEEEINDSAALFIEDLYAYQKLEDFESFKNIDNETIEDMRLFFINKCVSYDGSLKDMCFDFDKTMNLSLGSGLVMFKNLLISKYIAINIFEDTDFNKHIDIRIYELSENS